MNQLAKGMLLFLIACLIAAVPLQAATLTWTGAVNQVFNNPSNWSGTPLDATASLNVNTIINFPLIDSTSTVDVNELLIGVTAPGEVDMSDGVENITTTFRVGQAAGDSYFKMTGGTLNKVAGGNSVRFGWNGVAGSKGHLEMSGSSVLNIPNNNLIFGYLAGSTGYLKMSEFATANVAGVQTTIGYTGIGYATIQDSAVFNQTGGNFTVGFAGGTGTLDLFLGGVLNAQTFRQGEGTGSTGTTTVKDWSYISAAGDIYNGVGGGNATLSLQDSAWIMATNFRAGDGGTGITNLKGTSNISVTTDFLVGENAGGNATLNMQDSTWINTNTFGVGRGGATATAIIGTPGGTDNPTINVATWVNVGTWGDNPTNGTLKLYANSVLNDTGTTDGSWSSVGTYGNGTLELHDNSIYHAGQQSWYLVGAGWSGHGAIKLYDNSKMDYQGEFNLGYNWGDGGDGTLEVNGNSTFTHNGWLDVGSGRYTTGVVTVSGTSTVDHTTGGIIFLGRQGGTGTWNQNGGLTNDTGGTYLGEVWRNGDTWFDANATLNLNGGNYATPWIRHWDNGRVGGTQVINFNGGALEAQVDTGDFIIDQLGIGAGGTKVFVSGGGAKFNTADPTAVAHYVRVNLPLQHDPAGPAVDGGLTKIGDGTLALSVPSSLNGPLVVTQGTLNLTRSASLASTSVTVASGATLSLESVSNLGALNTLNLQSGSTLGVSLTPTLAGNAINVAAGGVANTSGVNYVVNAQGTSLALGTYPIVTSSAIPVGVAGTVTTNMRAYSATAIVNGAQTEVDIVVSAGSDTAKNLTWNPVSATPYPWDIRTTTNWTGAPDSLFWNLDSVTFDNTLLTAAQSTVSVVGTVHPSAITIVAPATTTPWLFQGTGAITGVDTTLTLTGPGKATFNNLGGIDITGLITLQGGGTFETGADVGPTTLTGNVALSGGSIISVAGRPLTLTGVISDDGTSGLIKAGGGRLVIANNANTYAGPTKISGGYLVISTLTDAGAGGTPSSLGVASNAGTNLVFNGGTLHYTGPSTTVDRSYIVTSGVSGIRIDNDLTLTADIDASSGPTVGELGKTGFGTLTFANPTSHVNTLANTFLVNEGPARITSGIYSTTDWMDVGTRGNHASFAMTGTSQLNVATSLNMGGYGNGAMEATMTDSTAITTGTWFSVGREDGVGTLTMGTPGGTDNPTITNATWMNVGCWGNANGTLIMNANSKLILNTAVDGSWSNFGYANNSHASVILNDNAQINGMGNGGLSFSAFDTSSATVSLYNNSQINQAAPGQILFCDSYGTCVVDLYNNSQVNGGGSVYVGIRNNGSGDVGYGSLTLHDNSRLNAATLIVGDEGSDGNLNVNDTAQVHSTGDILMGQEWGDSPAALGPGGKINLNSSAASVTAGGSVIVGANGGIGIYTQNAGTTTSTARAIVGEWDYWDSGTVANQTPGNGTLNLNGGVFVAPQVTTNSDPAGAAGVQGTAGVINFNGGVLKASAASSAFITTDQTAGHAASTMTLNVLAGGAKIDSNGFDVSIALPLAHAGAGTDGGLEKEGLGTLTLTGPISYDGPTLIDAGRLSIDNGLTTTLTTVSGAGWFAVGASNPATVVNATSIEVGTLSIGSGFFAAAAASSEISQPSQVSYANGKSLVGSPALLHGVTPVPEPGTLTLLALAGLALAGAYFRRK